MFFFFFIEAAIPLIVNNITDLHIINHITLTHNIYQLRVRRSHTYTKEYKPKQTGIADG